MLERMEPTAGPIRLPPGYGTPTHPLDWADVHRRIEDAPHYWLATTRPDGRPHVVPVDAVWAADACFFGGHADTVHLRNLRTNPHAALHLEDAVAAVIVEGRAQWVTPSAPLAEDLAAASGRKYGYAPPPETYRAGVWRLAPSTVLAWRSLGVDATRFRFADR